MSPPQESVSLSQRSLRLVNRSRSSTDKSKTNPLTERYASAVVAALLVSKALKLFKPLSDDPSSPSASSMPSPSISDSDWLLRLSYGATPSAIDEIADSAFAIIDSDVVVASDILFKVRLDSSSSKTKQGVKQVGRLKKHRSIPPYDFGTSKESRPPDLQALYQYKALEELNRTGDTRRGGRASL